MNAIEVDDLGHRYAQRWALRHVSFEVAGGEILGLLGPNGAGKTTAIKILTGQLRPTEGRAYVEGLDVVADASRLGRIIGVTFEQQNLYERLTVRENLVFFGRLHGVGDDRVREVLSEFALLDRARDGVTTLSKGLRQRLMLARAVIGRPRVLFLDEPTGGLDPQAARDVRVWVRRLTEEGTTVLLATHAMEEAEQLCSRVAILHEGSLVALDTPDALIKRLSPPRLRVSVRYNADCAVEEVVLPSAPPEAARELARLGELGQVESIHETSPSLADVFLILTGSSLEE